MSTKTINIILAVLFVLFALLQYNDPDPWRWILMYSFVAVLNLMAAFKKIIPALLGIALGICVVWSALLLPDFIEWIKMGTPNIAGEMKTEEPHIELVREFLGLVICFGALIYQFIQLKKQRKVNNH